MMKNHVRQISGLSLIPIYYLKLLSTPIKPLKGTYDITTPLSSCWKGPSPYYPATAYRHFHIPYSSPSHSSINDPSIQCPPRPVWKNLLVMKNLCLCCNPTLLLWLYSCHQTSPFCPIGALPDFQYWWRRPSICIPLLFRHCQGQKGRSSVVDEHLLYRQEKGLWWTLWL